MLLINIGYMYNMVNLKKYWLTKAEDLKKEGKFEDSIEVLDKIKELEREEEGDDFWYKRAIHYCDLGEYDLAKNALRKELEINQKNYETLILLGKILYELKEYEESLECLNKASEEHGSLHLRNTQKIGQMKNVHKFEEAVKYSDLVHHEKTLDYTYWHYRGMTLLKLKKFIEASSCFEIALETDQDNPRILYVLAKSELFTGNKEKSFEILEKICSIDPLNKGKLRIDRDFDQIAEEKRFRVIIGLLNPEL